MKSRMNAKEASTAGRAGPWQVARLGERNKTPTWGWDLRQEKSTATRPRYKKQE